MVKKRTKEEWINYLNQIHHNKYDYSLTDFSKGVMVKVIVKCHKHGEWKVTLDNHSTKQSGCPKCAGKNRNKNEWVDLFNHIYNSKYDYSLAPNIIKTSNKIKIICNTHGIFEKLVTNHILPSKQGCPKCSERYRPKLSKEELEEKSKKIHYDDYIYLWETYIGYFNPMSIKCTKHGVFKQTIANHIQGQGCPICKKSKGELKIRQWLIENDKQFIHQKYFEDCINPESRYRLPFDFYLPNENICIEFDGEQHFKPCKRFGGRKEFEKIKKYDILKNEYCKNKKIKLIRIPFTSIKNIDNILKNE